MTDTTKSNLLSILEYANLTDAEVSELGEEMTRRKKMDEVRKKYEKKLKQRGDGRFYIRLGEKQVYGKTEAELYEKLFDIEFGRDSLSMSELFEEWKEYKLNVEGRTTKTVSGYDSLWNTYLKGAEITKVPLKDLKVKELKSFFGKTVKKHGLTKRYFSELKGVVSGILDYALEEEIVSYNCTKGMKTDSFAFRIVDTEEKNAEVYSVEDRAKLLEYLSVNNTLYSLAIQLAMYMIVRIGELLALRWDDISEDGKYIRIRRQLVRDTQLKAKKKQRKYVWKFKNYVKGRSKDGFRDMPLTSESWKILGRIKKANPDSEYLFINKDGEILYQDTFNERLKDFCKDAGIEYFSSHKIRFCVASYLYCEGVPVHQLQRLLGHTTVKMTLHYLRNVKKNETIQEDMEKILCAK